MDKNIKTSPVVMKKIDSFVKKLSYNLDETAEEIKDFEEEMTSNLVSSFSELVDEGYSDDEALKLAFTKFGDTNYLRSELSKLYNIKNVYAKKLLKSSIIVGLISLLLFVSFVMWNSKIVPWIAEDTFKTIKNSLNEEADIHTEDFIKSMNDKVKNNIAIDAMTLEYSEDYTLNQAVKDRIIYKFPNDLELDHWGLNIEKQNFFMFSDIFYSNRGKYDLSDLNYNVALRINTLDHEFFRLAEILLVAYWVMFLIWSSLDIYLNDKHKLWIVLIALTNVVGYGIYYSTETIKDLRQKNI